jgi:hypothetical protein
MSAQTYCMHDLPPPPARPAIQIHLTGQIPSDLICTIDELGPHAIAPFQAAVIDWLKDRGVMAIPAHTWETPGDLCERLHISRPHLRRCLEHHECPAPLDIMRGPTSRIRYIRSHAVLDKFLTRHLPEPKL